MAKKRRRFGSIRALPSGRFQASFVGPDGRRQNAPHTFKTRTDADRWLVQVEADISRGVWLNENLGLQLFGEYARAYLRDNLKVGRRWEETCLRNLRLHLAPLLDKPLVTITPAVVRQWHGEALRGTGGRRSIAQSYSFLRAVMNQAVRDGVITRNPCQIPGATADRAKERQVATPTQVAELVAAITPRYRAAVLLAAWCGLRRGEVCALHLDDIDLQGRTVTVRKNRVELLEQPVAFDGDPKSEAGRRTVNVPPHVLPVLAEHMREWAGQQRVFVGRDGRPMRGDAIRQAFTRARAKVGMDCFTFHDLRHTGQTLAAATGATLADLMLRLGHSSPAAANRYLHAVAGRDREVAAALSKLAAHGDAAKLPRTIVVKS
ncbi:putative prophage phiRv2 integrase [Longimycelium tulufanense]|uniref:Putative prophage phiRv2 integrase n=1 Tax=Longimycelium tulufanense TaxID=907463 RepID=A0A8J3CBD0_9PSEU|nr:tyrosine-type recombinase/integrase [Longimycelium tulufanense]GGM69341.1 putative prophage phiRv2 integrase [Longimycelium tulufanense]